MSPMTSHQKRKFEETKKLRLLCLPASMVSRCELGSYQKEDDLCLENSV